MKDLVKFILESQSPDYTKTVKYSKQVFDDIKELLCDGDDGGPDEDDDRFKDEDDWYDYLDKRIKIIKDFFKDAKTIRIETSLNDYWENYNIEFIENPDVEKESFDIYKEKDAWYAYGVHAILVKDNVMYVNSNAGNGYNGEYFDMKIIKTTK